MLPEGFLKNMRSLLGEEECALLESALSEEPSGALRLNPLKGNDECREELIKLLGLEKISYEQTGYYFEKDAVPGRRPFHDAGAYYVQDPSAMIPGALLCGKLFENAGNDASYRILDLCAAPGGKSTQIAAAMAGRGILVSNEINRSRAEVLSRNIERMGIRNAIVLNETSDKLAERFGGYFDAIVVDAPCSGEGMFRKDPEAVRQWSEENVSMCAERQKEILENAYLMLRPGGVMVYSTCTFEKSEDEDVVEAFMSAHPDMSPADTSFLKKVAEGCSDGNEGCKDAIRLWPMHFKGEGHFAALLEKKGESERAFPSGGFESASSVGNEKILRTFLSETVDEKTAGHIMNSRDRFRMFGDNLFLMPEETPSLSGLKVLRCGLHLGTFKKDRFEPSHAFALTLNAEDAKLVHRVNEDDAEEYVKGMTLEGNGSGWCLVMLDGFSVGWGKAGGGRIKNHYPKGLRIQG